MTAGPTVVWLTLESTRADHTSLEGYDRDTTPNLRRIASSPGGRSFSECFAHGNWTLSSSASILTGTYPSHHDTGMESDLVPESLKTVPEAFGELGYRTACLSTNFHISSATGLDRGFDRFAWLSRDTLLDVADLRTLAKYAIRIRRHSAGLTTDTKKHSTGYVVTEVLKRWIRSLADRSEPFFLYAHYGDPHHPYYPPLPYHETYLGELDATPAEAREAVLDHHENLHQLVADGCPLDNREWALVEAMYDAEIRYTDALVGQLFDYLRSRVDDLVFVVTGDHGELFGEEGMLAHKVVLNDAVSHVPLVVYGLDSLLDYDGETIQHVDVVQTILESLGHEFESGQGMDLRSRTRDYCVLQRGAKRARKNLDQFRELNPAFDDHPYHHGTLSALRANGFKYLHGENRTELHRLPDEQTDVAREYGTVAESMHTQLEEWLETVGRPHDSNAREGEYSEAMKAQLADLGYLE